MDIFFGKLHAENFMSFREVDFDFGAFGSSVVLVTGRNDDIDGDDCRNGAGKTTVFNALLYAVYGETLRPPKQAKHLANWNCAAKDDVKVSLRVSVDGVEYEIDRFLVGKRKAMELHVYRKGESGEMEEVTRSTIAETQKMLETDVVPCGKGGFLRCVLLTADRNYNFFELGKAAKNEFFEALFELTTYSGMYQKLHRDALDAGNTLVAQSRTMDQLNASIAKLRAERDAEQRGRSDIEAAKAALSEAVDALSAFDARNRITAGDGGRIVFSNSGDYDAIVERGRALAERVRKGRDFVEAAKAEVQRVEMAMRSAEYGADRESEVAAGLRRTVDAHGRVTSMLCDKCLPRYREEMKLSDCDGEIARREAKAEELRAQRRSLEPELEKARSAAKRYSDGVAALEAQVEKCRGELLAFKDARAELQRQRDRLAADVANREYRLRLLTETAAKSFDAPIKSLEDGLAATKAEYDETDRSLAHLRALETVLTPESIRRNVVPDMLRELNFRIQGYLSKMGSNYSCSFDEDFDAVFVSSNGVETEYNNFSSGERMRLGIACCFAFKDFMQVRLNIRSNILVLDEYIDSNLDPLSVNGIMELIRYMVGSERTTAFIISHRSEVLNAMSDAEVLVSKKGNESSITVLNRE